MNTIRLLLLLACLFGCTNVSQAQNGNQPYVRFTFFTGGDDLHSVVVSLCLLTARPIQAQTDDLSAWRF